MLNFHRLAKHAFVSNVEKCLYPSQFRHIKSILNIYTCRFIITHNILHTNWLACGREAAKGAKETQITAKIYHKITSNAKYTGAEYLAFSINLSERERERECYKESGKRRRDACIFIYENRAHFENRKSTCTVRVYYSNKIPMQHNENKQRQKIFETLRESIKTVHDPQKRQI